MLIGMNCSNSERVKLQHVRTQIRRLWQAHQYGEPEALKRMRPINIMISGPSGVGKTTLAQAVAKYLARIRGESEDDCYYVYSPGDFPWEGYDPDRHTTILFDEFLQSTDAQDNGKTLRDWYVIMENTPYICNTAFEDKGKKRYKALVNIFTTNNGDLKQSGVMCTEAFFKRLDFNLRLERNGNEWVITEAKKPNYVEKNFSSDFKSFLNCFDKIYEQHKNEKDTAARLLNQVEKQSAGDFVLDVQTDHTILRYEVDPAVIGYSLGIKAHNNVHIACPYDNHWGQVLKKLYTKEELRSAHLHASNEVMLKKKEELDNRMWEVKLDWKPTAQDVLDKNGFIYDPVKDDVEQVSLISAAVQHEDRGYYFGIVTNAQARQEQDSLVFYGKVGLVVKGVVSFSLVALILTGLKKLFNLVSNMVSTVFSWFVPEVKPQSREDYTKSQVKYVREGNRAFRNCVNDKCKSRVNLNNSYCGKCGTRASETVERQSCYNVHAMTRIENNIWSISVINTNGTSSSAAILMLNSQHGITAAHTLLDTNVDYILIHKEGTRVVMYPEQYKLCHNPGTHNVTLKLVSRVLTSVRDISDLLPEKPIAVQNGTDVLRTRWDVTTNIVHKAEGSVIRYMSSHRYRDTDGSPFLLAESYLTDIVDNAVGFCGSPYFIYDKLYKGYLLAGIHVAADSDGRALVSCISSLDLPADFKKGVVIKQHKLEYVDQRVSVPEGTHSVASLRDTFYAGNDTKYSVSPFQQLAVDPYPVTTHFPLIGEKPNLALMKSTRFHHHRMRPLIPEIDQLVTSRIHSLMKGFWLEDKFRELSLEEAIKGYGNLKKLDMTTSVGPTLLKKGIKERRELFDSNTGWIDDTLRNMIVEREAQFESLEPEEYLCALALKDEPLPFKKVIKRVFYVYDLVDLIILRKKFGYMMHHQLKYHIFHGSTVGVNPHSVSWTLLAKMLMKHPNYLDSDYSKLDVTISEYMFRWFWLFIIRYYGYDQGSHQAKVMYMMLMAAASPLMVAGHRAFRVHSLNTSGWFLTLMFNDFVTQITHRVLMEHYWVRAGNVPMGWQEHVVLKSYGDDMIKSFSDEMRELFTPEELASDMLSVFGLVLTNADKTGPGDWKTNIKDVDFISRQFVNCKNFYYAPLVNKSFCKMMHWVQRSATVSTQEVLQSILYTAMHELLPKGRSAFDDFMSRYKDTFYVLGLEQLYLDFDFMEKRYLDNYTNTVTLTVAELYNLNSNVVGDVKPNPVRRCDAAITESGHEHTGSSRSVCIDK